MFCNFDGREKWCWKGSLDAAPLYNLKDIFNNPDKLILFVEGEKTADAAEKLLGDVYCATTSVGGAQRPKKTSYKHLAGRDITVFPDNDDAGKIFADNITDLAKSAGANSIRIVQIPPNIFPEKWDLADPLPEGVIKNDIQTLLDDAKLVYQKEISDPNDEAARLVKPPFRLTKKQLLFCKKDDEIEVCSRIELLGISRNKDNDNWGKVWLWLDPDGYPHTWLMPFEMEWADVKKHLLKGGLTIKLHQDKYLRRYLQTIETQKRIRSVTQIGWYGTSQQCVFILPGQTFGNSENETYLFESTTPDIFSHNGTLDDWKENVAKYAYGNSRLILALSASLAAPLLNFIGGESHGFHFHGRSSKGKTTILDCASSVWGNPEKFKKQWRATDNGLEGLAETRNDTLLPLDEVNQVDGEKLKAIIYMLGNGQGKNRSSSTGNNQRVKTWRLILLSTGEIKIADKINEDSGKTSSAGVGVRIIDILAEPESGHGVFENLHDFEDGVKLSMHLKAAAKKYHGTASRELLDKIVNSSREVLSEHMATMGKEFIENLNLTQADSQVFRVANHFANVAVSGELAIEYGILPLQKGSVFSAIQKCVVDWIRSRGSTGDFEIEQGIDKLRLFLELHGDSRFTPIGNNVPDMINHEIAGDQKTTFNRAGFKKIENAVIQYWIFPETFKKEFCNGQDASRFKKALFEREYLIKGSDGKYSISKDVPGLGKKRVYVVSAKIFEKDCE